MARLNRRHGTAVQQVDIIRDVPGRWYHVEAAADALNIPFNSLAEAVSRGKIAAVKFAGPGGYRVQLETIQQWLKEQAARHVATGEAT